MNEKRSIPDSDHRKEKQQMWDRMAVQVEAITDKVGTKIDAGIKETIIAFNLLGFKTSASCEGHLESSRPSPWIHIEPAPRDQREELTQRYHAVEEEIEKEEAIDTKSEKLGDLYDLSNKLDRQRDSMVLPEIKRLADLLEEFYLGRETSFGARIIIDIRPWSARLQCQGAEIQRLNDLSTRAANLEKYQAEFRAFTEFLKKKIFEK